MKPSFKACILTGVVGLAFIFPSCKQKKSGREGLTRANPATFDRISHDLAARAYIRSGMFSTTLTLEDHVNNLSATYRLRGLEINSKEISAIWSIAIKPNHSIQLSGKKDGPADGLVIRYDNINGLSDR